MSKKPDDQIAGMFDVEWEKLLLANAVLRDAPVTGRILAELETTDFTALDNRNTFEALREMADAGYPMNLTSLGTWLGNGGKLHTVGGWSGISRFTENYCSVIDLDSAIGRLRRLSIDRQAYHIATMEQELCAQGYSRNSDEVAAAQEKLASLQARLVKRESIDTIGAAFAAAGGANVLFRPQRGCIPTPWIEMNEWMNGGLKPGELTLLAARPSVGKSTAALQIAYGAAAIGKRVRFYSLEMRQDAILKRLFSMVGDIPHGLLVRGDLPAEWRNRVVSAMQQIQEHPLAIIDDLVKFSDILGDISRSKPELAVIDYLGLIESSGRFENRNQEISYISRRLKVTAAQHNIPLLVLSQLSRASDIENRPPRSSDLRDSGTLEQDADMVLFLHAPASLKRGGDAPKDQIQALIDKQRNGERNKCLYLRMEGQFCRIV